MGDVRLNNSALYRDRTSVSPVISAKFGEYVRDMALHRRFADGELIGNQLIGIPSGDKPQNIQFPPSQLFIRGVLRQLGGEVVAGPFDAPWVRMAVVKDPQGATFIASQFVAENKDLPG